MGRRRDVERRLAQVPRREADDVLKAAGQGLLVVSLRTTSRTHLSGVAFEALAEAGGDVTRTEVTDIGDGRLLLRIHCRIGAGVTQQDLVGALDGVEGCEVESVEDAVFLVHAGGKVGIDLRYPIVDAEDLSQVYTPGVARVCTAIAENPARVRDLTIKSNTVAVVTDGSAVLGLGNIGPEASLPVMEGKAALFKRFAGIDAWPIALDTQDVDEIVRTVVAIAPVFGGINLEDISAPRCFEVERRLRDLLHIPVFHDDQHGTAVVVLAALQNAARVVGKGLPSLRVVMTGAGAAGAAVAHLLLAAGVKDIVLFDTKGALYTGRDNLDPDRTILAERTNPRRHVGNLTEALLGADVFIGLSRPGMLTELDVAGMADGAIVFALANPDPEIDPRIASRHAAVVATGRSDFPNQINNVLAFPGIFRGLLDSGTHVITDDLLVAAADSIATAVDANALDEGHIVPSVFEPGLADRVAEAIRRAIAPGVSQATGEAGDPQGSACG